MKIKHILLLLVVGLLAGCSNNKPTMIEEHIVILPPENLWQCPEMPQLPDGAYTQKEVAKFILDLYEQNRICKESIKAVREYLIRAKELAEED